MFANYVSDIYGRLIPINVPTPFAPSLHTLTGVPGVDPHLTQPWLNPTQQPWLNPQAGLPFVSPTTQIPTHLLNPQVAANLPGIPQQSMINPLVNPLINPMATNFPINPMVNPLVNPLATNLPMNVMNPMNVPINLIAPTTYPFVRPTLLPTFLPQFGGLYTNPAILPQSALAAC
jgi:hypothetical protein